MFFLDLFTTRYLIVWISITWFTKTKTITCIVYYLYRHDCNLHLQYLRRISNLIHLFLNILIWLFYIGCFHQSHFCCCIFHLWSNFIGQYMYKCVYTKCVIPKIDIVEISLVKMTSEVGCDQARHKNKIAITQYDLLSDFPLDFSLWHDFG